MIDDTWYEQYQNSVDGGGKDTQLIVGSFPYDAFATVNVKLICDHMTGKDKPLGILHQVIHTGPGCE